MCRGGDSATAAAKYVYHERQLGALCGVHCVNNLLQGPRFGPGDLAEIGVRLDRKERRLLAGSGAVNCRSASPAAERSTAATPGTLLPPPEPPGASGGNFDGEPDGGNFSVQVLHVALARAGLQLLPSNHPEGRELLEEHYAHGASPIAAFVVQRRNHWLALRSLGPCWWNLDSLLQQPKPLDDTSLASLLKRLSPSPKGSKGSGGCLFLVRSDNGRLPAPFPPQAECGNWHQVGTLLDITGASSEFATLTEELVADSDSEVAAASSAQTCEYGEVGDVEMRAALALVGGNPTAAVEAASRARRSAGRLLLASPEAAVSEALAIAEDAAAVGDNSQDLLVLAPESPAEAAAPPSSASAAMEAPAVRLAMALPAQVEAVLKAKKTLPDAVARLVAVLCVPSRAALEAAAQLVDCRALAHRLVTALARKAKGCLWTQGLADAATVAIELLLGLPAVAGGLGKAGGAGHDSKDPQQPTNDGNEQARGERSPKKVTSRSAGRNSRHSRGAAGETSSAEASSGSGVSAPSSGRPALPGAAAVAAATKAAAGGGARAKSLRRNGNGKPPSAPTTAGARGASSAGTAGDEFEALDDLLAEALKDEANTECSLPCGRPKVSEPGLRCAASCESRKGRAPSQRKRDESSGAAAAGSGSDAGGIAGPNGGSCSLLGLRSREQQSGASAGGRGGSPTVAATRRRSQRGR